jgi:hypothetical protein
MDSVVIRFDEREGNSASVSFQRFARYDDSRRVMSLSTAIVAALGLFSVG